MIQRLPPIYFYIPQRYWPDDIPASADENWKGFGLGINAWTLQTYLRLKADGFPCQLTNELPTEGIVLIHRNSLRAHKTNFQPRPNLLLICLKAELNPYPYAQLHIVQNPLETKTFKNSYFLPHWPQPALIPRNLARGDRFENIAFFGHQANLLPELMEPSWQEQLKAMNLHWRPIVNRNRWDDYSNIDNRWNDYSEVDAVVAVRSFSRRELYLSQNYISKPATKLYNAWLAGVPAILGGESAYRTQRQSELDYVEVASPAEILSALKRLRDDLAWRLAMVKNGQARAQEIHPSKITALWRNFLEEVAIPNYHRWRTQPRWLRQTNLGHSYLVLSMTKVQHKLRSLLPIK
ncbi:MAG: glycosyltransferase family 1 protein [Symploca sp. SIO2E9]|nr:glycosyltransferase family 1 protein [Symploca sp. SIO2E9]